METLTYHREQQSLLIVSKPSRCELQIRVQRSVSTNALPTAGKGPSSRDVVLYIHHRRTRLLTNRTFVLDLTLLFILPCQFSDASVRAHFVRACSDVETALVCGCGCANPNTHGSADYDATASYYEERAHLAAYTINTEISRMKYSVKPKCGGTEVMDLEQIRALYRECCPGICRYLSVVPRLLHSSPAHQRTTRPERPRTMCSAFISSYLASAPACQNSLVSKILDIGFGFGI